MNPEKIHLPPLDSKLDLMKNFLKAMDHNGQGFLFLKSKFPGISDAKIKEGIFVGPQIRKLMKNPGTEEQLNESETAASGTFQNVMGNFLGNKQDENYGKLVSKLLKNLQSSWMQYVSKNQFFWIHVWTFATKSWRCK